MERRAFIAGVASGLVIAQSIAEAVAAAKVYRIGILLGTTAEAAAPLVRALTEGLRDHGYVDGRNIILESRYADGRLERLPDLAAELVRLRVDVIITGSNVHVAAAQRATATIPIVMVSAANPVGAGFIASLARPGGNITGLSADASRETVGKSLALLKEIVPSLSRVGVVGPLGSVLRGTLEAAARQVNVTLEVVDVRSIDDFESAFAAMVGRRVGAVLIGASPLTYMRRQQIADLAVKHRLPAITTLNEFAPAGLLMTYGPNLPDLYRRAASYVARILRGAKPAELPVEQPTKFELTINLKTATALDLTFPQSLLLRADEVIQ